jgi:hypothetical protein
VQSLLFDDRRLYASMWDGSSPNVYRIDAESGGHNALGDSLLGPLDRSWPSFLIRPFPLVPGDGRAPTLFLARPPGRLAISTVTHGVFLRTE